LPGSFAIEAGRSPEALDYPRWGSIDMITERVEEFAEHGATRIVMGATAIGQEQQRDEMSAFAERFRGRGLSPSPTQ
jgi:hypothetical protein